MQDRRQDHTKAAEFDASRRVALKSSQTLFMRARCAESCCRRPKSWISGALLYLALRKVDLSELFSRLTATSLLWIAMAIAVTFLQIFVGVVRWREISAECGAPLELGRAMRYNVIGAFFNQTLPSAIGGDAVRLWLVARAGAGWRAATYSIFVDRAIGLVALAIVVVASLPWSYELITDPHGRSALLLVDFAALAGGVGFLIFGALKWSWLKTWWATHHIHACAVIANRVIFNAKRGPIVAILSLLVHVLAVVIAWCVVQSIAAPGQLRPDIPPHSADHADHPDADLDRRLGRARGDDGPGLRFRRAFRQRRRQRLAAVRRRALHRRRDRRPGLDPQRGEGRERVGAARSAGVSPAIDAVAAMSSLLAVAVAALMSAIITWTSRPLLQRYALARPNARSSHRIPTPQGAGIAVITATLLVASAWAAWANVAIPPALVIATIVIALVGSADDIVSLPVLARLGAASSLRRRGRVHRARDRAHRAGTAASARAWPHPARRRLVREPRQLHGRAGPDDGRGSRARHRSAAAAGTAR